MVSICRNVQRFSLEKLASNWPTISSSVPVVKTTKIAVKVIQVIWIAFRIEIHRNGALSLIISMFLHQGGPLVADESADAITKQDSYTYLVGVVSLGPKPWLVSHSFLHVLPILNWNKMSIITFLIHLFSGKPGVPGKSDIENYFSAALRK